MAPASMRLYEPARSALQACRSRVIPTSLPLMRPSDSRPALRLRHRRSPASGRSSQALLDRLVGETRRGPRASSTSCSTFRSRVLDRRLTGSTRRCAASASRSPLEVTVDRAPALRHRRERALPRPLSTTRPATSRSSSSPRRRNGSSEPCRSAQRRWVSGQDRDSMTACCQMVHPDRILDERAASRRCRPSKPVYGLTEGSRRGSSRKLVRMPPSARLPALPEWQEPRPGSPRSGFAELRRARSRRSIARTRRTCRRRSMRSAAPQRLAYDELLASQLALAAGAQRR